MSLFCVATASMVQKTVATISIQGSDGLQIQVCSSRFALGRPALGAGRFPGRSGLRAGTLPGTAGARSRWHSSWEARRFDSKNSPKAGSLLRNCGAKKPARRYSLIQNYNPVCNIVHLDETAEIFMKKSRSKQMNKSSQIANSPS